MAEPRDAPALKIEDLQVYYGESHAIQGVSMTIDHGVLAVVGRNGMGKSTLCNTIAGLKSARSGSIRIRGRETSRLEPHIIHRLGVGYVPQGYGHYIENSGSEDLDLLIVLNNGTYQSISLTTWVAANPHLLLSTNFRVPESTFANFPTRERFMPG